jgi:HK97 gp10 family phage protein
MSSGQFIAAKVTPAVTASVTAACQLVEQEAKSLCPVDTGTLAQSISFRVDEVGASIQGTIYAAADYAGYVEFGTGQRGAGSAGAGPYPYSATWIGHPAQPFLRPALDTAREAVLAIFRGQIAFSQPLLTGGRE